MPIRGVMPVLQLPYCDDGTIDWTTFEEEINWVLEQGVAGITLAMVTEVFRLTDRERDELVTRAVRGVGKRGPVIASVGAESIVQAVRHAHAAEDAGADALMAVPPCMTRCDEQGIDAYYTAILEATSQPVIIQDASGYVGNAMSIQIQADLYHRYPERVMFKPEAPPLGQNLSRLRDATQGGAPIFEGSGGIALMDSFQRGIVGTMPGAEVCWAIVALWEALESGDERRAREIHFPLAAIVSMQHTLDAFVAVEKMLLVHQGVFKNAQVREPVGYRLDDETTAQIMCLFDQLKQIVMNGS